MELNLRSIPPVLLALLVVVFVVIINKWRMRSKTQNQNLKFPPPGPWKLPVLGNLHNMLGLPHRTLADLAKKHGPVMHLQLGELSTVVISSAKAAEQVMKTHDLSFADRPKILAIEMMPLGSFDVAFAPYGSYWRQMRMIFKMELLSAKRVQSLRSIREEEVSNLIQNISSVLAQSAAPINITEKIFWLTGDITARAAFGRKCKDKNAFMQSITELVRVAGGFGLADVFPSIKFLQMISGLRPKLERLHNKLDKILDDIIDEHREKRKSSTNYDKINGTDHHNDQLLEEDLVDVLLRLQESGETDIPITNNHIKAAIMDVFTGGTETTSSTVEWVMSEIVRNPRVMEKAQAEVRKVLSINKRKCSRMIIDETAVQNLNYLKLVINETLRFHSAVPLLLPRECREGCEIGGYDIPVKTQVLVNAFAIGRDPETWGTDADRFVPERFEDNKGTIANFEYLPFGAGRRVCPGILYASANVELAIAQLLYHFDWKLPNGVKPENLDMTEAFGATVRRKNDLYLIPTPYVADELI